MLPRSPQLVQCRAHLRLPCAWRDELEPAILRKVQRGTLAMLARVVVAPHPDIGCGLGDPARYFTHRFKCRVRLHPSRAGDLPQSIVNDLAKN